MDPLLGRGREVCCLYSHRHARRSHVGRGQRHHLRRWDDDDRGPGVIEIDTQRAMRHSNRGYVGYANSAPRWDSRCNW